MKIGELFFVRYELRVHNIFHVGSEMSYFRFLLIVRKYFERRCEVRFVNFSSADHIRTNFDKFKSSHLFFKGETRE